MKKKKTQLLGIVLSAAMLATSVPAPVYAEPTDNVAEEEDSDAAAVQETTDEADAVADDATDDSTAADDATPEEADEQDTADELMLRQLKKEIMKLRWMVVIQFLSRQLTSRVPMQLLQNRWQRTWRLMNLILLSRV